MIPIIIKTKLIKLMFVVWGLIISINVFAYDFEMDGFYYNITSIQDSTVELTYGELKYTGDLVVPDSVAYLNKTFIVIRFGDNAFSECSGITSIMIPNSVVTMGVRVFYGCTNLTSLSIPSSVTRIGNFGVDYNYCFGMCTKLENLIIEDGESTLTFFPNDWLSGSIRTFVNCNLKSIYLGRNISFSGGSYDNHNVFYAQRYLTEVNIGPKVTSLMNHIFNECSKLEKIIIPGNVTDIGYEAFNNCVNLKTVILEEGVEIIGNGAFRNCNNINELNLPSSISFMSFEAFIGCTNIKVVYSAAEVPGNIYESTFSASLYLSAVLYVPTGSKSLYEAATGWENFSSIVETDNFEDFARYYSFNISTTIGGNVSVFNNTNLYNTFFSTTVIEGKVVILQFTPNSGYYLKSLFVNNTNVVNEVYNSSYTISYINENTQIIVAFAELPTYLAIKNADKGSVSIVVEKGNTYTTVICPNEGWEVNTVSFNSIDVTSELVDNTYTTPTITGDSELSIVYKHSSESAINTAAFNRINISAAYGQVVIENNDEVTTASVYSTNGALVKTEHITIGTTQFRLDANKVYIIKVGSEIFKLAM